MIYVWLTYGALSGGAALTCLAESLLRRQDARMMLLRRLHFGPVPALRDAQG